MCVHLRMHAVRMRARTCVCVEREKGGRACHFNNKHMHHTQVNSFKEYFFFFLIAEMED